MSYNDSDVEYKKTFEKHFKVLGRKSSINFIDKSQVAAGENVKAFIRDKIDTCKAIMCLISSDYLSDQWNYDIELSKAIDRSDTKTCLLIPVIIRDCNWEDAPINNLKPVLFGNSPLFSNHDKVDEYLTDAVNQVKRSIENFIKNQDEFTDKTI